MEHNIFPKLPSSYKPSRKGAQEHQVYEMDRTVLNLIVTGLNLKVETGLEKCQGNSAAAAD
jgi:hypothetical protein